MPSLETSPQVPAPVAVPEFAAPEMARIPAGWFRMGDDAGRDDERPAHRVWVDEFELAVYQTTNAEYSLFLSATRHPKPLHFDDADFCHPQQPVVGVSWFDAAAYCDWLSRATGRRYRLPTEAEWERAARGGVEGEAYPWGDATPESLPDYFARWKNGPEPVERGMANRYGLRGMCENVHEWCADWYDARYYARSSERNPEGPAEGVRRASRGGAWRHHIKVSRSAARSSIPPEFRYADYGFRVACDPDRSR